VTGTLESEEVKAAIRAEVSDSIATLVQLEPDEMDALLDARSVDVAATTSTDDLRWLLDYAARSEAYTLPQTVRDLAAGVVTLEALQNPTPTPMATPLPTSLSVVTVAASPASVETPAGGAIGAPTGGRLNPFLLGALALLALLLAALLVFLVRTCQRKRET